jgi:hypothetical protein
MHALFYCGTAKMQNEYSRFQFSFLVSISATSGIAILQPVLPATPWVLLQWRSMYYAGQLFACIPLAVVSNFYMRLCILASDFEFFAIFFTELSIVPADSKGGKFEFSKKIRLQSICACYALLQKAKSTYGAEIHACTHADKHMCSCCSIHLATAVTVCYALNRYNYKQALRKTFCMLCLFVGSLEYDELAATIFGLLHVSRQDFLITPQAFRTGCGIE